MSFQNFETLTTYVINTFLKVVINATCTHYYAKVVVLACTLYVALSMKSLITIMLSCLYYKFKRLKTVYLNFYRHFVTEGHFCTAAP